MVNFAPEQNGTYMSVTPFPTPVWFLSLLPESVRPSGLRAYADVITKFSGIDRFPFSFKYGATLRTLRARADASLITEPP